MKNLILPILLILLSSCGNKQNQEITYQAHNPSSEDYFEVKKVIQTTKYTYLKVLEKEQEAWYAISKMDVSTGEKFYYGSALKMINFHSEELDRDFETIYFIDKVSKTPLGSQQSMPGHSAMPAPSMHAETQTHQGKPLMQQNSNIDIQKSSDELNIAQIYAAPSKYADQQIMIRGIVVKINKNVMGKNWIHLQDGSSFDGKFDLTVTSQELPVLDEEVSITGTLRLDKDFGSGYRYDLIVEEAVFLKGI